MEMIGNAEKTYMKPNEAFYEEMGGAPLQELVGGKWLEMPAEEGGFTMSTFWSSFSEDIPKADELGDSEYTSEVVDHNGEEVYKYSGTSAENGEPVAMYVTKENKLVRVEVEQGADESTADSTDEASASPDAGSGTGPPRLLRLGRRRDGRDARKERDLRHPRNVTLAQVRAGR